MLSPITNHLIPSCVWKYRSDLCRHNSKEITQSDGNLEEITEVKHSRVGFRFLCRISFDISSLSIDVRISHGRWDHPNNKSSSRRAVFASTTSVPRSNSPESEKIHPGVYHWTGLKHRGSWDFGLRRSQNENRCRTGDQARPDDTWWLSRNVEHISMTACGCTTGKSLIPCMIALQDFSTVRAPLENDGILAELSINTEILLIISELYSYLILLNCVYGMNLLKKWPCYWLIIGRVVSPVMWSVFSPKESSAS
jgi:hypothetical protein